MTAALDQCLLQASWCQPGVSKRSSAFRVLLLESSKVNPAVPGWCFPAEEAGIKTCCLNAAPWYLLLSGFVPFRFLPGWFSVRKSTVLKNPALFLALFVLFESLSRAVFNHVWFLFLTLLLPVLLGSCVL